jgi:phosphoribosylanthranilate isomerase
LSNSKIKICGITKISTLICCIENNIDFYGMIFFNKSPRNIKYKDALNLINYSKNKSILSVGVFVDEPLNNINQLLKNLKMNIIQLHGQENDSYISAIKKKNDIKVIKNIAIDKLEDFNKINNYPNSDYFLFDYKPLKNELPGGNSKKFSWDLLKNIKIEKPWFISGGINITNINDINGINGIINPYGIDISSGVEVELGIKSNEKIISLRKKYESR